MKRLLDSGLGLILLWTSFTLLEVGGHDRELTFYLFLKRGVLLHKSVDTIGFDFDIL